MILDLAATVAAADAAGLFLWAREPRMSLLAVEGLSVAIHGLPDPPGRVDGGWAAARCSG